MTPADCIARHPRTLRLLQRLLTPARLNHTLGCAQMAAELAVRNRVSPDRACLAGLLHDCARDLPEKKLLHLVQRYRGRHCPPDTRSNPKLWHGPAGVILARDVFHIRDTGVLRAIGLHSTGEPRMRRLDQILFVSDYCEPTRTFSSAAALRTLAYRNLDRAVAAVVREKTAHLRRRGAILHSSSRKLAEELGIRLDP